MYTVRRLPLRAAEVRGHHALLWEWGATESVCSWLDLLRPGLKACHAWFQIHVLGPLPPPPTTPNPVGFSSIPPPRPLCRVRHTLGGAYLQVFGRGGSREQRGRATWPQNGARLLARIFFCESQVFW